MSESPSHSEPPPPPQGTSQRAADLRSHPLWKAAAGQGPRPDPPLARGRGRGRKDATADAGDNGTRFERISLLQLELQQAVTGDGAESALLSDDSQEECESPGHKRARTVGDDDESDAYVLEDEDSDEGSPMPSKKKQRPASSKSKLPTSADIVAAAAFGGQARYAASAVSDIESEPSRTSSKRRKEMHKQAFPVKGIRCVGCSLSNRIGPVERFVNENVGRMSEGALWKMASLTWQREVVEPALREGVEVVQWPWKDVANHFRLHTTNQVIGRTAMIQSLTAMRCQVEQNLVRVENGERTLDKANADLFLKIVAADSRERQLLAAGQLGAGRGRGARSTADE